jgi:hypothetical protein
MISPQYGECCARTRSPHGKRAQACSFTEAKLTQPQPTVNLMKRSFILGMNDRSFFTQSSA